MGHTEQWKWLTIRNHCYWLNSRRPQLLNSFNKATANILQLPLKTAGALLQQSEHHFQSDAIKSDCGSKSCSWLMWSYILAWLNLTGKQHINTLINNQGVQTLNELSKKREYKTTFYFFPLSDKFTWMAAGYGERAVEPRLRPNRGLSGVLSEVCVARQYASRYSAKCSHASSSWFSSRIISNISWGGKAREESVPAAAATYRFLFKVSPLVVAG